MTPEYEFLTNRKTNVFSDLIFRRVSTAQNGVNVTQQQMKKSGGIIDSSVRTKLMKIKTVGVVRKNKDLL